MNLAICIGASDYKNIGSLPACSRDLSIVTSVLKSTEKYEEILTVNADEISARLGKQKISDFVERYSDQSIEEIFFYFTGHGDFDGEDFFFLWSDYQSEKKRQTTLQNSELDEQLRSLAPDIAVKVVDACQSGVSYIKDKENIKSYLEYAKQRFKNCYFMFSSMAEQSSFADEKMSYFTRSFLKSLDREKGESIRYRDIIDFLADDLIGTGQDPYFVTQANFTEVFYRITETSYNLMRSHHDEVYSKDTGIPEQSSGTPLVAKISQEAEKFLEKEDALKIVRDFGSELKKINFAGELKDLFEPDAEYVEYNKFTSNVPNSGAIGKWIKENDNNLFVEIEEEERQVSEQIPIIWDTPKFRKSPTLL